MIGSKVMLMLSEVLKTGGFCKGGTIKVGAVPEWI